MNLSVERLLDFERRVYSRQYTEALKSLFLIIRGLEIMETRFQAHQFELDVKSRIYTRLGAAITSMIADRQVVVNDKLFEVLMLYKRGISDVFRVTSFQEMDHLIVNAIDENQGQTGFSSKSNLYKALFACTLGNDAMDPLQLLEQIPVKERGMFWLSLLDQRHLMSQEEERRFRKIAEAAHLVEEAFVPADLLVRIINAWFFVSYHTHENKHELKKSLNTLLRNSMEQLGVQDPRNSQLKRSNAKPKMAVLAEVFKSRHAMFRCYSPALRKLNEEFDLTLVAAEGSVDEGALGLFDQVLTFQSETPIKQIVGKIHKLRPDIIFYPSLGMETWPVATAQLRLAPVQIMALGHPATSMSDVIDYAVLPTYALGDPDCFSETLVVLKEGGIPMVLHPDYDQLSEPEVRTDPDIVRVAVPCNELKLNEAFLELCERITEKATRPFEFHFFPNAAELYLLQIQKKVGSRIPAHFHMPTSYVDYMETLKQCDIQISTIPFGNSNGYLDGLIRGLPIVSMSGREVHSCIDNGLGRLAGLPEWCLTTNQEDFVDGVVRLIDNDSERRAISDHILSLDLEKVFCSTDDMNDLPQAVHWMYQNHEKIQEDGRKCWMVEDRFGLS